MHLIYLAGNSPNNKTWIEKVKNEFDLFSSGEILYYDHWNSGKKFIDFEVESKKLASLVKDKTNYFIFAKSVGSLLALKTVYEKSFHPQKILICGHPYLLAKEIGLLIDDYLKSLTIPTTFIQNEFDPLYSFVQLQETLKQFSPTNYKLLKIPNNSTHDYEDYEILASTAKSYFIL